MCGRYTQAFEIDKLKPRFRLDEVRGEVRPRYNVAPSQEVPVVLREDGRRVLDHLRWGLVPVWTQTLKGAPKPINARAETV
ncbi:MAG: SOS response-associated peptidase family protein, partial [Myxococcales bacterium]